MKLKKRQSDLVRVSEGVKINAFTKLSFICLSLLLCFVILFVPHIILRLCGLSGFWKKPIGAGQNQPWKFTADFLEETYINKKPSRLVIFEGRNKERYLF